jgi:hypothetical protein
MLDAPLSGHCFRTERRQFRAALRELVAHDITPLGHARGNPAWR